MQLSHRTQAQGTHVYIGPRPRETLVGSREGPWTTNDLNQAARRGRLKTAGDCSSTSEIDLDFRPQTRVLIGDQPDGIPDIGLMTLQSKRGAASANTPACKGRRSMAKSQPDESGDAHGFTAGDRPDKMQDVGSCSSISRRSQTKRRRA